MSSESTPLTSAYEDPSPDGPSETGDNNTDHETNDDELEFHIYSDTLNILKALESRVLAVLGHDLELAARLIPQIYSQLRVDLIQEATEYTSAPAHNGSSTSRGTPGDLSSILSPQSQSNAQNGSQKGKHPRGVGEDDDDDDDEERERSPKTPRIDSNTNSAPHPTFACPFYKKDSQKYGPLSQKRYQKCIGPGPTELRRIK